MNIREGSSDDVATVLGLLDEAVAWMVSRGNTQQWGTRPWSEQPAKIEKVEKLCASGLWIAELDGEAVGVLVVGTELQDWIPPVDEPELYVRLLVASRRHAGQDIGGALLRFARERARAEGVDLLRVDCWAGDNGRLVGYYVRQGFTPTATFTVGEWPGQVLEMRP